MAHEKNCDVLSPVLAFLLGLPYTKYNMRLCTRGAPSLLSEGRSLGRTVLSMKCPFKFPSVGIADSGARSAQRAPF